MKGWCIPLRKQNYKIMLRSYPDVLDIKDIADILRISTKTTYKLLKNEDIKHIKIGPAYRVPKVYMLDYLYRKEAHCG